MTAADHGRDVSGEQEGEARATGFSPEPGEDAGVADQAAASAEPADPAPEPDADPLSVALAEAAERTADLQRLQAEFLNYKRRVDRDRELVRQNAIFAVLAPILDVLDNLDRAREHGELTGGFKGVADQLERIVSGLGLTRYAAPGEPFDPNLHEALSHLGTDPDVDVVTIKNVAKAGYRIGDRVLRAAQVLVVDPAEPPSGAEDPTPGG